MESPRRIAALVLALASCSSGTLTGSGRDGGGDGGGAASCGDLICPEGTECVEDVCLPVDPCREVECENPGEVCSEGACVSGERDGDGDGSPVRDDCDDADPSVLPGTTRPCVDGCGEGSSTCLEGSLWSECVVPDSQCSLAHAEAACVDGSCSITDCETGFDDCDGDPGTGCETALGTRSDCARCDDRCGGGERCQGGACVCVPSCAGADCGDPNGCGGICRDGACPVNHTCEDGECRCEPDCAGAACNDPDGCGGRCSSGSCPSNERCQSSGCVCPSPSFGLNALGQCVTSCGRLLSSLGYTDLGAGCCGSGCAAGVRQAGGPNATYDCTYCCESNPTGPTCL